MKKIYTLVAICLVVILVGSVPAVYAFYDRYKTVEFGKDLDEAFNKVFSEGISIKSNNDGNTYLISSPNVSRLYDVLSYTKHRVKNAEGVEGKEKIEIDIFKSALIEVLNFDESEDIAYIRLTVNGEEPSDWFAVKKLKLFQWVDDITDADGYNSPNKAIGN
ncbi:MAG: hypothetical protein ACI4VI_09665 [Acutalibacteraceae bacterium]